MSFYDVQEVIKDNVAVMEAIKCPNCSHKLFEKNSKGEIVCERCGQEK